MPDIEKMTAEHHAFTPMPSDYYDYDSTTSDSTIEGPWPLLDDIARAVDAEQAAKERCLAEGFAILLAAGYPLPLDVNKLLEIFK